MKTLFRLALFSCCASLAVAQSQSASPVASSSAAPAASVSRTLKAMHFRPGSSVKIDFHSTELMQGASGEAKIEGKKANITIDAKFQGMDDATKFGLEYLT